MKISYLSGAYKNAGDFLIEKRATSLLKYVYPDAEINVFLRNQIQDRISDINQCDFIVFGGGPIYKRDLEGYLPLDICIDKFERPVYILGGGWYGLGSGVKQISCYKFSQKTYDFLKKIENNGSLSCRDNLSYQILKAQGFNNVYMTGCPAWYDLEYIDQSDFSSKGAPQKIVISDPAQKWNQKGCLKLVDYLKDRFSSSKITFVFHRGSSDSFRDELSSRLQDVIDISGSSDGFHVYDDCDLHIGYRVHAHIYNLSIRNRSVLIEEDGRGAGVNQTLGLQQIKAYNDHFQTGNAFAGKVLKRMPNYGNDMLVEQVASYLDYLDNTDYLPVKNAYALQQSCFNSMISFIKSMDKEAN